MNQMDKDNEEFVERIFDLFTGLGGKGSLRKIGLFNANVTEVISDVEAQPYSQLHLKEEMVIPYDGRLKLEFDIREPKIEREISVVLSLTMKDGILSPDYNFDTPYLDTLKNEADVNKIVNPTKLENSMIFIEDACGVLISLFNSFITSKTIKTDGNI